MNTTFERLVIQGWRQFEHVELDLHPNITVITGANGSGKSTLLNIFSQHFGWYRQYLATPVKQEKSQAGYMYHSGLLMRWWLDKMRQSIIDNISTDRSNVSVGKLRYSNDIETNMDVSNNVNVQYDLQIPNRQSVAGIHVSSHRPMPNYQNVTNIPTQAIKPQQAYDTYRNESLMRYTGQYSESSPVFRIKEALLSMATFGKGNEFVDPNAEALEAYLGFIEILKKVLPENLGFINISIRTPDVVLVTKTGEFMIDAASGGLLTLVDLAWQIYMYSLNNPEFTVTIDEPENHLHPSMQRSLLPNLVSAFPDVQFIIATHSPFVVSSVKDSSVYVLDYQDETEGATDISKTNVSDDSTEARRVVSKKLDTVNKAGNATEILRQVLGVPSTIPLWVEDSLAEIINSYRDRPINEESLEDLKSSLTELGYGDCFPEALISWVNSRD